MIRKTLTILSLFGLLLSVGLWGVSYCGVGYTRRTSTWLSQFILESGGIRVVHVDVETVRQMIHDYSQSGLSISGFNGWQTSWKPDYILIRSSQHFISYVTVPFWLPTLLLATMFWYLGVPVRRRRKRMKLGLCLKCGYDLRGSKDICPECGTEFESSGA